MDMEAIEKNIEKIKIISIENKCFNKMTFY